MKVRVFLAVFCGVIVAIPAHILFDFLNMRHPWILTLAVSILFSCFLLIYFILHKRYTDSKYEKSAMDYGLYTRFVVFLVANGNFELCGKIKNCNIYFCEDRVVFLCLEHGKVSSEELLVSEIDRIYSETPSRLFISTTDNKLYIITTPDIRRLSVALNSRPDWLNKYK